MLVIHLQRFFFLFVRLCFPYEYKIMLMWQGGTMAVIECVYARVFFSLSNTVRERRIRFKQLIQT